MTFFGGVKTRSTCNNLFPPPQRKIEKNDLAMRDYISAGHHFLCSVYYAIHNNYKFQLIILTDSYSLSAIRVLLNRLWRCKLTSVLAKSTVLKIVIFIVHTVELKIALFKSAIQVINRINNIFHGRYKEGRKVCAHLHC